MNLPMPPSNGPGSCTTALPLPPGHGIASPLPLPPKLPVASSSDSLLNSSSLNTNSSTASPRVMSAKDFCKAGVPSLDEWHRAAAQLAREGITLKSVRASKGHAAGYFAMVQERAVQLMRVNELLRNPPPLPMPPRAALPLPPRPLPLPPGA